MRFSRATHAAVQPAHSAAWDSNLPTVMVNEKMIMQITKNLLGCSSVRVLPGKEDIADSCPIAVDAQKSKGEGNLGYP